MFLTVTVNVLCIPQGGGARAHGQMERQIRVSVQDERQRVYGRARSVHLEDIREKGESGRQLTFCSRWIDERAAARGWERDEKGSSDFCFHERFSSLFHTLANVRSRSREIREDVIGRKKQHLKKYIAWFQIFTLPNYQRHCRSEAIPKTFIRRFFKFQYRENDNNDCLRHQKSVIVLYLEILHWSFKLDRVWRVRYDRVFTRTIPSLNTALTYAFLFRIVGTERRQILPEIRLHRFESGRIRRSWPLSKKMPLGRLRRETSSG